MVEMFKFHSWNNKSASFPRPGHIIMLFDKSHKKAHMTNQVGDDFQQGCCLYKPTIGIYWTPKHLYSEKCLTFLRNKPWQKQTYQLLVVLF